MNKNNYGTRLRLRHLLTALLAIGMCLMAVGSVEDSDSGPPLEGKPGAPIQTGQYEIVVSNPEKLMFVGNQLMGIKQPSQGAEFVMINWSYKNITKEPISSWDNPEIVLIDPNGAEYSPDAEASLYHLASGGANDEKALSKLNPGIKINGAEKVYEVASELIDSDGWKVKIKADKTVIVPVQTN